ncbi:sigma-70 family RNA polymerase sigma factor [filamentous cyanobacterium LEGE 11480]|uniref:Sigma-70 family RNA polymerase sigma factor n=1 Tax=Romeriopsis navalis LEGE 11480 TaxID=2777977 RepID=A0A928VQS4_9CYAN|nr:sigma-70 family RNA polymerase sigma factor [Romeriopsis navalis LEGE 11480]
MGDRKILQPENHPNLSELYDTYGEAVYRLSLRMLNNASDAEDLTQEVFVDFWQKQKYDPDRGSLITFLLMMTRSRALNRIRKRQSRQQLVQRWEKVMPMSHADESFDQAALSELSVQIRNALQEIPEAQRQVLELAYYEGLSQSEITERLEIPLGTVKTRSRQGLLKLRKLLHNLMD